MANEKNKPSFIVHDPIEPASKTRRRSSRKKKPQPLDGLNTIYEENGEMPDMTKLERKGKNSGSLIAGIIAFLAVVAIAAWVGFFVFKPYARNDGEGIALAIKGLKEVKAGDMIRYEFTYDNTTDAAIAALELRLVIPNEFHIIDTDPPQTADPYVWTLGTLERGANNKIVLRGYFLGPDEGRSAFQSIATYRPSNFNSDFEAITTHPITIMGSVLEGFIEGPNEAAPGEELSYIYTVTNTGGEPLENLEVRLEPSDTFIFVSAEPTPTDDRNVRWSVPKIEPSKEMNITFKGSFSSTAKDMTDVNVAIGARKDDDWFRHRTDTLTTDVLASDVALELFIQGGKESFSADFGDTIPISLSYQNLGNRTIGDLVISLSITASPGGLVDWDGAEMGEQAGRIRDGVITWTKNEIEELRSVRPGEEKSIDFTLPLVSEPPTRAGTDELRFIGNALISTLDGRVVARQVQTAPIIVSLNSDFTVNAGAEYFDDMGNSVGSGPLPPQVGEPTHVRVFWDITNTRHDLTNLRVRTTLPQNISWAGSAQTNYGSVHWNEATRTVTLDAGTVPAESDSVTAQFEVSFTPTSSDAKKFITLTTDIVASAKDARTETSASHTRNGITTELLTDEFGNTRGAVVE